MLERQVRLLQSVCRCVSVAGPPEAHVGLDVPIIPDEVPGRGPLGAIYSGLAQTRSEYNLFLGCDLPFMEAHFLRWFAAQALLYGVDATVPKGRDGRHPLCNVYRRRVLPVIRDRLACGQNAVRSLFSKVRCRVIPWTEITRAGFSPRIFANMNLPEDYEAAKRMLNGEWSLA